ELGVTSYIKYDVFEDVMDTFITYKVELKNALPKPKVSVPSDVVLPDHMQAKKLSITKLPKISIPIFSGKYNEWSSFRDLILSLIDDNEANGILKRLLNQNQIAGESSVALKELLDTTTDCLHDLATLGVKVDAWDIIIIYLISSKLDAVTRKQWELQKRFRALEFVEPQSNKCKDTTATKSYHIVSNNSSPHCSEQHRLCHCKKFAQKSIEQRRNIIVKVKKEGTFECQSKYNNINNVCLSVSPLVKLFARSKV
ncbi:hypothetical protein SFRURICE_006308, partial [Spodoptera frugiperda]